MKCSLSPYPYFGKKTKVAPMLWDIIGKCGEYIEPFFGGGAVYLEGGARAAFSAATINDLDHVITNIWRALKYAPRAVAEYADAPTDHATIHAYRRKLAGDKEFKQKMSDDAEFYDAKYAGHALYILANWIGCDAFALQKGEESSQLIVDDGIKGVRAGIPSIMGNKGIRAKVPHITSRQGISSAIPHMSGAQGIKTKIPSIMSNRGIAVVPDILDGNTDDAPDISFLPHIYSWFSELSRILGHTKILCVDWTRVKNYIENRSANDFVFLDPPYGVEDRDMRCYTNDSPTLAKDVRNWLIESKVGDRTRCVYAGYDIEVEELVAAGWEMKKWKANGGYSNQKADGKNDNPERERLAFSPKCGRVNDAGLFD